MKIHARTRKITLSAAAEIILRYLQVRENVALDMSKRMVAS